MRKHGIDMWVVPMREYNEDPVFTAIVAPETFAARRRTIYVFFDTCAAAGHAARRSRAWSASRSAAPRRAASSRPARSTRAAAADVGRGQQAELWGDEQWQVLKAVIEERNPRVIGINRSTVFAFSDGLSSGELKGMTRRARRAVDVEVQGRRRPAARAHRLAAARRRGLLPAGCRSWCGR